MQSMTEGALPRSKVSVYSMLPLDRVTVDSTSGAAPGLLRGVFWTSGGPPRLGLLDSPGAWPRCSLQSWHTTIGVSIFFCQNVCPVVRSLTPVKWVRSGPLTLGAAVSILRTAQAGAAVFLKSEPGPVAVVSARPWRWSRRGFEGNQPEGESRRQRAQILGSLRAEIAFDQCGLSLPLTLEPEVATYKLPARKAELSKSVPGRSWRKGSVGAG